MTGLAKCSRAAIGALGVLSVWGAAAAQQVREEKAATAVSQETSKAVRRGERLATFGGCHDCHSPKIMTPQGPQPDKARLLSGYPASSPLPQVPKGVVGPNAWGALTTNDLTAWAGPWGVSFAANLTPDVTGLAGWSEQQFIQTMRTGKHLGVGRPLLPPMPWFDVAALADPELRSLFAYLQSVKPISNQVPQPIPPK